MMRTMFKSNSIGPDGVPLMLTAGRDRGACPAAPRPQFAAESLFEPMRTIGFEFQDMDLVNGVLGYCSYQPFLPQMFGHRLVELMHRERARRFRGRS